MAAGSSPTEFVVDTGADDVLDQWDVGRCSAIRKAINGRFDTAASRPTRLRRAAKAQGAGTGLQTAERAAGGAVEQDAITGKAGRCT